MAKNVKYPTAYEYRKYRRSWLPNPKWLQNWYETETNDLSGGYRLPLFLIYKRWYNLLLIVICCFISFYLLPKGGEPENWWAFMIPVIPILMFTIRDHWQLRRGLGSSWWRKLSKRSVKPHMAEVWVHYNGQYDTTFFSMLLLKRYEVYKSLNKVYDMTKQIPEEQEEEFKKDVWRLW